MLHTNHRYRFFVYLVVMVGLFSSSSMCAQMINNREGKAFESPITFNRSFIWENKIASIQEKKIIKMTGRPLVDLNDETTYHFGLTGLLEKSECKQLQSYLADSTSILFKRNDIGQLFEIETKKGNSVTIEENVYDQTGKIKRSDSKQKIAESNGESRDILIESTTYEYSFPKEFTIRRENINNYGLAFSAITTERNAQGFLISEEEEWYISKKIAKKTYAYNEKGWVESITTSSNDAQPLEIIQYTYDDRGNVQTAKKLIDGVAVEEYEVIYQNGALVKAILHQDLMSTAITIHKYEYTFR